jgi:hypothetical protein
MGLLGGIARTAVVAGTATAVSNRVSRRQYNRWAQQDQQQYYYQEPQQQPQQQYAAPAPAASAGGTDQIQQLKDLADLKNQGILTEEEFAAQKAKVLGS